jgi:hypothetical protein
MGLTLTNGCDPLDVATIHDQSLRQHFYKKKKRGVISLSPLNFRVFCKHPQNSKALTLMYQTRIYFQFPPSVRVFREILMDQGINYPFIPHSKTTSFWALKLHRFGLQNDVVLAILSLIFLKRKKKKENIKKGGGGGKKSAIHPLDQKWGGRPSRVSDEPRRNSGFNREKESGPSQADEIDDWGAAKKSTVGNNGFDRRERERGGGGFFNSQSRADDSDNWGANKAFMLPTEGQRSNGGERKVGFASNGGADAENWLRMKKEESTGTERPRLNL